MQGASALAVAAISDVGLLRWLRQLLEGREERRQRELEREVERTKQP